MVIFNTDDLEGDVMRVSNEYFLKMKNLIEEKKYLLALKKNRISIILDYLVDYSRYNGLFYFYDEQEYYNKIYLRVRDLRKKFFSETWLSEILFNNAEIIVSSEDIDNINKQLSEDLNKELEDIEVEDDELDELENIDMEEVINNKLEDIKEKDNNMDNNVINKNDKDIVDIGNKDNNNNNNNNNDNNDDDNNSNDNNSNNKNDKINNTANNDNNNIVNNDSNDGNSDSNINNE